MNRRPMSILTFVTCQGEGARLFWKGGTRQSVNFKFLKISKFPNTAIPQSSSRLPRSFVTPPRLDSHDSTSSRFMTKKSKKSTKRENAFKKKRGITAYFHRERTDEDKRLDEALGRALTGAKKSSDSQKEDRLCEMEGRLTEAGFTVTKEDAHIAIKDRGAIPTLNIEPVPFYGRASLVEVMKRFGQAFKDPSSSANSICRLNSAYIGASSNPSTDLVLSRASYHINEDLQRLSNAAYFIVILQCQYAGSMTDAGSMTEDLNLAQMEEFGHGIISKCVTSQNLNKRGKGVSRKQLKEGDIVYCVGFAGVSRKRARGTADTRHTKRIRGVTKYQLGTSKFQLGTSKHDLGTSKARLGTRSNSLGVPDRRIKCKYCGTERDVASATKMTMCHGCKKVRRIITKHWIFS